MTAHERACALSAYVGAGLTALAKATGAELPTAEPINDALVVTGQEHDTVRSVILDLYIDLRNRLAGGDPAVAVAFGLGRMLADTVLLPTSDKPQILVEQFGKWRLGNAFEWLDDLDASLPPRAGVAVRTSLRAWEEWVDKATKSGRTIRTPKVNAVAMRALRRQGNVWRRLLTGEQPADHLLDAKAYVSAAAHLLGKARRLTFHYLWKWSWAIVPALAAVGTAVWASVTYAPAGTGRVVAVIASAAGFLGVSWTAVRGSLGQALRQGQAAMWEAEVVAAIGKAATILPEPKLDRPEPPDAKPDDGGEGSDHASPLVEES
jgi:hypothetical protein